MIRSIVTNTVICIILTITGCGYALLRGGAPERLAATIILLGCSATTVVISSFPIRHHHTEIGVLAVDVAVLAALLLLAVRANRFWPIGVAGTQLIGVAGHLVSMLEPRINGHVYAETIALGIYPMLLLLTAGTYNHIKRLRTRGGDRSWVSSFSRAGERTPIDGQAR